MAHRKNIPTFEVDTFEKAKAILEAKSCSQKIDEQLTYIFDQFPELENCTHQLIGDVMILERETVTRAMGRLKKAKRFRGRGK